MHHHPLPPDKCPRCLGRGRLCVCAQLRPAVTRTRFVVIRHVLESTKQSNTARMLLEVLTNAELRNYGLQEEPLRTDDLARPGTWLLFPGGSPPSATEPFPERVVVIDGSWSQARHMVQRLPVLRTLPRLSLPTLEGRQSLRQAPPGGMSTLEAVARAVEALESLEAAEPLDFLHQALVGRVLQARGYL